MKPLEPTTQLPDHITPAPQVAENDDAGFVYCFLCNPPEPHLIGGPFTSQTMIDELVATHMKEIHGIRLAYAQETENGIFRVPPKNDKP